MNYIKSFYWIPNIMNNNLKLHITDKMITIMVLIKIKIIYKSKNKSPFT